MINLEYGIGHSLLQTNKTAPVGATVVTAGMVVNMDSANSGGAVGLGANSTTSLLGFALRNSTDSDVIASGVISMILLDGNTVVETDQAAASITVGNYTNGAYVYPQTGNTGLITTATTVARILGTVTGIRSLPGLPITVNGIKTQGPVTVLGIKLAQ